MTTKQTNALVKARDTFMHQLKTISKQVCKYNNNQAVNDEIINNIDMEIDIFFAWNSCEQRSVIAINTRKNAKTLEFNSIEECAEHFMLEVDYVRSLIEVGGKYRNYYFDWGIK
jgi:hypothetical protein